MTARTRLAVPVAMVLAIVVAGAWWFWRDSNVAPVFVTAMLARSPIEATVIATGTLNAVTTVQVGTYVSGRVREIYVDFNSRVKRGQIVARIDSAPLAVQVEQAEAVLATAHARFQKAIADRDYRALERKRHQQLSDRNVLARGALEAANNAFSQADAHVALERAGIAQADAALAEARINLAYTDIVSPVDGVVLSRNVDVGQTVAASFQTPTLFLIAEDLAEMRVNSNISESDIGRIRNDQRVRFSVDAFPDRVFAGVVSQRRDAPITERNVVTYDVVIDVANDDLALKPGMTATVTITTDQREDALVLPLRALRFRPKQEHRQTPINGAISERASSQRPKPANRSVVWIVRGDESKLEPVEVETGIRSDEFAEVLSGEIAVGDVLALAYERADDGKRGRAHARD
ncbi:MAG: efflux RND transporter periplasmic adaptor subunit [Myxococcota bacterium]